MGTNLTGGKVPNATRIDAACWLDGNDDELIIEFQQMQRYAEGQDADYQI